MDKKTQDLAWACLPKEARDEIRKRYQSYSCNIYTQVIFETIFGEHNLTSDTEPEEMLMVEKKEVKWRYALNNRLLARTPKDEVSLSIKALLDSLFGDKCLPDKELNEDNFAKSDLEHGLEQTSVQVEPKFEVGNYVVVKATGEVRIVIGRTENTPFSYYLDVNGTLTTIRSLYSESELEPYTEENENKRKKTKELSLSNSQPTETDPPAAEKSMQRAWCEYRNMEYVEGYVNPLPSDNFVKGYEYGRRDATKNQWRSVIDGLPEPEQDVFVAVKAGDNYTYGYAWLSTLSNGTLRWYSHDDCLHLDNIKFWMPIPNLPNP